MQKLRSAVCTLLRTSGFQLVSLHGCARPFLHVGEGTADHIVQTNKIAHGRCSHGSVPSPVVIELREPKTPAGDDRINHSSGRWQDKSWHSQRTLVMALNLLNMWDACTRANKHNWHANSFSEQRKVNCQPKILARAGRMHSLHCEVNVSAGTTCPSRADLRTLQANLNDFSVSPSCPVTTQEASDGSR